MARSFELSHRDGLAAYEQAAAQGDDELGAMGFPPAQRPQSKEKEFVPRPQVPTKASDIGLAEVTDHMLTLTGWHSYALEVLSSVESERNLAKSAREFTWSRVRDSHSGTVADKDDKTRCDERFIKANIKAEVCEYKYRRVRAICEGLMREIETLSRAMTSKEQEQRAVGAGFGVARQSYAQRQGFTRAPARSLPFTKAPPRALPPMSEDEDV